MSIAEVRNLTHRYGRQVALRDVSFGVPAGSVYALLGPNGAGKTTLLQILMGLVPPTSGEVRVFDTPLAKHSAAHRARIGYVAEGLELPNRMTLAQLERYLAPLYPSWDKALADSLRERFQLDPSRKLRTLSRGEYMKAALLCALAPRPELLVMDEPFTGMDAAVKDDLVRGVLEMSGREGWSVIIASHDLAELELLADWVGFLNRGSLQLHESMDTFRARFRWVDIATGNGNARLPSTYPKEWVWAEAAGARVRVLVSHGDDAALKAAANVWFSGATRVDINDASLRDVFVALTRRADFGSAAESVSITSTTSGGAA